MTIEAPPPLDITHLPLREAALAIGNRSDFTIGNVSVNYEALLRTDGMTHRGLALQEARVLGKRMLTVYQGTAMYPHRALVTGTEIGEARIGKPNRVLASRPMLVSGSNAATDRPARPHAWIFGADVLTSGPGRIDVLSVSLTGKIDGLEDEQAETYRRSLRGLAGGLVTSNRLPAPKPGEPEDPNDLFYVAEMALLRAARRELYDRAASDVIE